MESIPTMRPSRSAPGNDAYAAEEATSEGARPIGIEAALAAEPVDVSNVDGRDGFLRTGVIRNPSIARLYEHAVLYDGGQIAESGALCVASGKKTGRSPNDKRIVDKPGYRDDVWWGDVNTALTADSFEANRRLAVDYLTEQDRVYVVDAFAGWEPETRVKIRVVCARPYHALFMRNMLIRPTDEESADYGEPDYVIFNAGGCNADPCVAGVDSTTSVALDLERGEMVILGTDYAGEMKKGVFTIMNYLLPKQGVLSMHCSANRGDDGAVSLFFGLSGTGKTTLSADPNRSLIGDDEHGWGERGVFNIEGGCYAKCLGLRPSGEPEVFRAIRFGTVLENTVLDRATSEVDYSDGSRTENTRASYPIDHVRSATTPCVGGSPRDIVFLTCDAFGVLPPVSLLSPEQAMYHFLSGYTAKIAGTEMGVDEPQPIFSACFGAPFLVWPPMKYATMLGERMRRHGTRVYLVNTGWTGGPYGVGTRIPLRHTRAIVDAIHEGSLAEAPAVVDGVFGLRVPTECRDIPTEMLRPRDAWTDGAAYDSAAARLAGLFNDNFRKFESKAARDIVSAGPVVN